MRSSLNVENSLFTPSLIMSVTLRFKITEVLLQSGLCAVEASRNHIGHYGSNCEGAGGIYPFWAARQFLNVDTDPAKCKSAKPIALWTKPPATLQARFLADDSYAGYGSTM